MKKWIKEHLFLAWIISSIIFAVVIHCLFSKPASREWFSAKWGAGDILTYVSTIALGLLAVWQNKKFKEDSDELQGRMENLTIKANEISIISKIVEYESARIAQLKMKSQNFIDACNTEKANLDISDVANQPNDFKRIYVKIKMDNRCSQVRETGINLLYELELYNADEKVKELIRLTSEYSSVSLELIQHIRTMSNVEDSYAKKKELEKQFIQSIFKFITDREKLLNKVIYGDFSFAQIRAMYGEVINKND